MTDPVRELKTRAGLLERRLHRGDPAALIRLRSLPEYRSLSVPDLVPVASAVRRRQCLSIIAIELGFSGWQHASAVLTGAPGVADFGTLLYPRRCGGLLNLWYRNHAEAVRGHEAAGGYLLAYRRQCLVVDRLFIETMGLDPDAPEWRWMGYDWVRPRHLEARTGLYGALIAQLPRELAA